ncbi:inactive TPR repeat-containing thioredoxin TTL3-like [Hordeum vulgare subsp. vulgare]|uniref:inactive TPR repeat-containing thioredoxin TTL3-like n=1 Tax=Hordeum vulgare subsp. vulgare TaxID=112509 RepID=UPI001D1A3A21|nr:inactive TPR repeat-containing thioredoxin TTL3-like [Hordeum vulgare subsp. vulgare]
MSKLKQDVFDKAHEMALAATTRKRPTQRSYNDLDKVKITSRPTALQLLHMYKDIHNLFVKYSAALVPRNVCFAQPVGGIPSTFKEELLDGVPVAIPYDKQNLCFFIIEVVIDKDVVFQFPMRFDSMYCCGFRVLELGDDPLEKIWYSFGKVQILPNRLFKNRKKSEAPRRCRSSSESKATSGRGGGGRSVSGRARHSGELAAESGSGRNPPPGHRRSGSGPLIFSGGGGSTASSPLINALPADNICSSGRVVPAPPHPVRPQHHHAGRHGAREEAVRLDPASGRAHGCLAALCLRKIASCRKDWKSALREADAAIANGVDSSQLHLAMRSEVLLRLNKLEEADSTITGLLKLDSAGR